MTQGDGPRVLGDVDLLSTEDLRRLAEVSGPCVTLYLPSTPFGPGTRSGPSRLHRLANEAAGLLAEDGMPQAEADELLAPLRRLKDDEAFWQHQGEGLALFAAPDFFEGFRLPTSLSEQVVVDRAFRLLPLVSQTGRDTTFYVLAITQNHARVLRASEHAVGELDLPGLPESMESAIPEAEPDRVRGVHSVGALGAITHGQGTEEDYDKKALERWFRAVDDALVAALPDRPRPLVLACVAYYVPTYRSMSRYPAIHERAVEGSPERRSAQELHDDAWALVAPHFAQETEEELAHYREAAGTGRTAEGPKDVLAAAREGRVETLLLDTTAAASEEAEALEGALAETLRRSGRILSVGADAGLVAPVAAVLRY